MTIPPFRADHVGGLVRPERLCRARKAFHENRIIDVEELRDAEDAAIREAVRYQEDSGLPSATDGGFRRSFTHLDFIGELEGIQLEPRREEISVHGAFLPSMVPTLVDRLAFPRDHAALRDFGFLSAATRALPKVSVPSPATCHALIAVSDIHSKRYREEPEALFEDLARSWASAVTALYDAGCRYLQFDDVDLAHLCRVGPRATMIAAGGDPDRLLMSYAEMIGTALRHRPADMVVAMHLDSGDTVPDWYEGAFDMVFNATGVDVFLMPLSSSQAGRFDPLRALAKGSQRVMAGLIDARGRDLERLDELRRALDAASRIVDLEQLGIAPNRSFAVDEGVGEISIDDERRKLDLVVRTAEAVWGGVDR